jgi:CRISPR-associated protein Cas2
VNDRRHIWFIAYDVSSDRSRTKLAARLRRVGKRIQYSVFSTKLTRAELDVQLAEVAVLLDESTDSVIAVRQCTNCAKEQAVLGQHRNLDEAWWVLM